MSSLIAGINKLNKKYVVKRNILLTTIKKSTDIGGVAVSETL